MEYPLLQKENGGIDFYGVLEEMPIKAVQVLGVGFGPGIPGLQLGFGFGAGCGVGLGFGYGMGKGIAQDENKKYSNIGNPFRGSRSIISEDDITALVDDLVINTKKLIKATSKEIDKWRR